MPDDRGRLTQSNRRRADGFGLKIWRVPPPARRLRGPIRRSARSAIVATALAMMLTVAPVVAPSAPAHGQGAPDPPVVINEFMASNRSVVQDGEGLYNDWIELWNTTREAIDLSGWHLTDDVTDLNQWEFPEGTVIRSGEFLLVFASGEDYVDIGQYLHTNFKLTGGGEYLGLTDRDTRIVHEYAPGFPSQVNDQSYGLDTSGNLAAFDESTPGAANTTTPITGGVFFSETHGFFDEAFELELSTATPGAWVAYSTDGTEPTLFSEQRYSERRAARHSDAQPRHRPGEPVRPRYRHLRQSPAGRPRLGAGRLARTARPDRRGGRLRDQRRHPDPGQREPRPSEPEALVPPVLPVEVRRLQARLSALWRGRQR